MKVSIDQPTPTEWVVDDSAELVHYYATLYPAGKQYQLIFVELGNRGKNHYEFEREVYSCTFFDLDPTRFANHLVQQFTLCRNRGFPVEMVYTFGGELMGMVVRTLYRRGEMQ